MITQIMNSMKAQVKHRVWVMSDLQQADPIRSRACLTEAIADFKQLNLPCDYIWYLGDAIEGSDVDKVTEMANMHQELIQPLAIPLRYVLGNHDFDILRHNEQVGVDNAFPFYNMVTNVPGWKSVEQLADFYYVDTLGDYLVVFLSDQCAVDGSWHTTNGAVYGDKQAYPYNAAAYQELSQLIASSGKRVITAGHYAFNGGNRPSALINQMLPLPDNFVVHLHGHAHIGDEVWAGKDCYRKIGFTEGQPLPQINVSSLENSRGNHIRSIIMEIYEDDSIAIFFRDHDRGAWAEMYVIEHKNSEGEQSHD